MYRTYRTTNSTVFGEEIESEGTNVKLLHDIEGRKYVMVKNEKEDAIYDLSLVGQITEIINDVIFEEYREYTYARLDKEARAQGIRVRKRLPFRPAKDHERNQSAASIYFQQAKL